MALFHSQTLRHVIQRVNVAALTGFYDLLLSFSSQLILVYTIFENYNILENIHAVQMLGQILYVKSKKQESSPGSNIM